jgi:hypothetical protein
MINFKVTGKGRRVGYIFLIIVNIVILLLGIMLIFKLVKVL